MNIRTHTNTYDRFKIYQNGDRGIGWNPNLREWELYAMDADGGIIDRVDWMDRRADAWDWLREGKAFTPA